MINHTNNYKRITVIGAKKKKKRKKKEKVCSAMRAYLEESDQIKNGPLGESFQAQKQPVQNLCRKRRWKVEDVKRGLGG